MEEYAAITSLKLLRTSCFLLLDYRVGQPDAPRASPPPQRPQIPSPVEEIAMRHTQKGSKNGIKSGCRSQQCFDVACV